MGRLIPPEEAAHLSIRFCNGKPVLYYHGGRVTNPWSIHLSHTQAEPTPGSSGTHDT